MNSPSQALRRSTSLLQRASVMFLYRGGLAVVINRWLHARDTEG